MISGKLDAGAVDRWHQLLNVREAFQTSAAILDKCRLLVQEKKRRLPILNLVHTEQRNARPEVQRRLFCNNKLENTVGWSPIWMDLTKEENMWQFVCSKIYWALATINLSKSTPFLGNFCEGVKIYHFWATFIDIWQYFSGHTGPLSM